MKFTKDKTGLFRREKEEAPKAKPAKLIYLNYAHYYDSIGCWGLAGVFRALAEEV